MDDQLVALDHSDAKVRVGEMAALDGLAHALSHDVRAAFRSTQGFATVVASRAADVLAEEDLALLQRIKDASQRGNDLLDQIVMWLRTQHHPLHLQPVDLAFVLEWSASEKAACVLALNVEGRAEVTGDEFLLKRLFEVLLSNACNFSGNPQEPARVHAALHQDDRRAYVSVRDWGVGLEPQHAERAFEPFVRLHAAAQGAGQGLGLAMAKTIVERHGGSISIAPAEGGGSVVRISLPREAKV